MTAALTQPQSVDDAPSQSDADTGRIGEMAARVAAFDWSATPLGARERWSTSLAVLVDTILASRFPMALRWGPDFALIYNDGYRPFLGDKHPAALGRPFRDIWPEVQTQFGSVHEDLLSGQQKAFFAEDMLVRLNRHGRTLEDTYFTMSYSPVADSTVANGIGGILINAVETTARVKVERALRESEERLQFALDAGGGVGTWDWDIANGLVYSDARFAALFSVDPDRAAQGAPIEEFIDGIHPDDRAWVARQLDETLRSGRVFAEEYRLLQRDGTVRWISARGRCTHEHDGKPARFPGVVLDITDRKWTEQRLHALNENLEQQVTQRTAERDRLWNVSDDLIGVANFEGYWVNINPAASSILGWSQAELLAMPIASLWHPDEAAETLSHRQRLAKGGPTVRFTNRYRHKDGSYRWLAWASTREGGHIYATARDVTTEREASDALRRTEEQLRQSQKMEAVGQLTGGIAHDFNNLLTGILGALDLMQKRVTQGRFGDIERYAGMAKTSANRAAALIHRLLAFARRQPLDPKPVNINELVTSMEELLRRTTGEQIELAIVTDARLWGTFCDPHQLESALLNLVINARDAMPDGGRLTITTANEQLDRRAAADAGDLRPGPYVALSVGDTGVGMSAAVTARAFDPFFTTKPIGQGTGLGLSMVYGFARQSEGHAHIQSKPGEGTTITIYLPRHGEAVVEANTASSDGAVPRALSGETVLVVEDETAVRELVIDVLSDLGYRALEAVDGPSGLQVLRSAARIDLMVTDVGLPGMNGRQLADAAREQRPSLKILFITGYAESAAMAHGFLEPGMEMVTKPFAVDALATRIRDMIAG